jgi:hypothetical protein
MSPALIRGIGTIVAGISGSISGVLVATEPRTLALTIWAVSLASLSTGILAWVHGDKPGTKARVEKAKQEAGKHNRD